MLVLLVVLCPPLAVLFAAPSQAPKNLGLTLLLYVPGVLHARSVVSRYYVTRRYDSLMRALDARTAPAVSAVAVGRAA